MVIILNILVAAEYPYSIDIVTSVYYDNEKGYIIMKIEGSMSQMFNILWLPECEPERLIGLPLTIDNKPIGKIISIDIDKDIFTAEVYYHFNLRRVR